MTESKDAQYKLITDQLIADIEANIEAAKEGKAKKGWSRPWNVNVQLSYSSRKPYNGLNAILLSLRAIANGFKSPFWVTRKAIEKKGGKVKEGANPTSVILWKFLQVNDPKAKGGKRIIPFLTVFEVFNLDQQEGISQPKSKLLAAAGKVRKAKSVEDMLARLKDGPNVKIGGDRACYYPATDLVKIPLMKDFHDTAGYYGTLVHEYIHATGHKSRLNRPGITDANYFGSHEYSREELIAEMGASIVCNTLGVEDKREQKNSVAYLTNWIKALKNDPRMLVVAAGRARKAAEYLMTGGKSVKKKAKKSKKKAK